MCRETVSASKTLDIIIIKISHIWKAVFVFRFVNGFVYPTKLLIRNCQHKQIKASINFKIIMLCLGSDISSTLDVMVIQP
jgi:hypothetical protein